MKNATKILYRYHTAKELNGSAVHGYVSFYGGGGYYMDLIPNQKIFHNFIVPETKAVFVDFLTFNRIHKLYVSVKLVYELPKSGVVYCSARVSPFYPNTWPAHHQHQNACLLSFIMFFISFMLWIVLEVVLMVIKKKCFACSTKTFLLFLITTNCLTVVFYMWERHDRFKRFSVHAINSISDRYPSEYIKAGDYEVALDDSIMMCFLWLWIYSLNYLQFTTDIKIFVDVLRGISMKIILFSLFFALIFLAFALLGFQMFGLQVAKFFSLRVSIQTLMSFMLSGVEIGFTEETHRWWGPFYVLSFMITVVFVLTNIFLAIFNEIFAKLESIKEKKRMEKAKKIHKKNRTFSY